MLVASCRELISSPISVTIIDLAIRTLERIWDHDNSKNKFASSTPDELREIKLSNLGNRVWYGDSFLPDYDLLQYYHRLFTSLPLFRFPKRNNISNRAWNGYLIARPRITRPWISSRTVRVQVLPGLFIGENIQIVMLKKFCHGQNVTNGGIKLPQKLNAWSQKSYQLISSIVEILNSGKIIKPWSTNGNHILINPILTLKQFHQSSIHRTNPKMLRNTGCKYFDNCKQS